MNVLAKMVSGVFHPIFVCFVFVWVLFSFDPYYYLGFSEDHQSSILQLVAYGTIAPSLIFLTASLVFFKKNLFGSWQLKDRGIGLLVIGFLQLEFWFLTQQWNFDLLLSRFFLCSSIVLLGLGIISFFWKISIHAAAWASIAMAILVSFSAHQYFNFSLLASIVLILGITASCRMFLQEHTSMQILAGTTLGVFTVGVVFWL